jgi:hypothetical protein
MAKTRVAIACQGGGSQTAFTAGALKALCELNLSDEFEIVAISGTSGGAVCAALVWYSYMRGERPIWGRLIDFWKDNTAQNWAEQAFNQVVVESWGLERSQRRWKGPCFDGEIAQQCFRPRPVVSQAIQGRCERNAGRLNPVRGHEMDGAGLRVGGAGDENRHEAILDIFDLEADPPGPGKAREHDRIPNLGFGTQHAFARVFEELVAGHPGKNCGLQAGYDPSGEYRPPQKTGKEAE